MTDLSWSDQVRRALDRDDQLLPDTYVDMYASTWLASHVRLVELAPAQPATDLSLLFFVASRAIGSPRLWKDWIAAAVSRPMSRRELQELIEKALSDVAEGDDKDTILEQALRNLSAHSADRAYSLSGQPYAHGPTYQDYWWRADTFFFLEIHNES